MVAQITQHGEISDFYIGTINSFDDIWDGDTIHNVKIVIYESKTIEEDRPLWLDIEMIENKIVVETKIRLIGIDAPEFRRVSTTFLGQKRTEECRENERSLGKLSRDRLAELIGLEFLIKKPVKHDKFGGRVDAQVFVSKDGDLLNVSDILIKEKLAIPYHGEKKTYDWCKHLR